MGNDRYYLFSDNDLTEEKIDEKEKILIEPENVKENIIVEHKTKKRRKVKMTKSINKTKNTIIVNKFFATYIGPPCILKLSGVGEITRGKRFEVSEKIAQSLKGSKNWKIEKFSEHVETE